MNYGMAFHFHRTKLVCTPVLKRRSYQQLSNEPQQYHDKVHLQGTNVNKPGLHLN